MTKVAPSILSADFMDLGGALRAIAAGGADYLHFDVMDGRFVPNITFGMPVMESLRDCGIPMDAHLMIVEPEKYVEAFARAGARIITVHAEATAHLHRLLQQIRGLGCLAGVALNPATPPECLRYVIEDLDMVLVMTVNPGFGGQKLIPACLEKVAHVRAMLAEAGSSAMIEVDGGVNGQTAPMLTAKGADVLVAGSSVFCAPDPAEAVRVLKRA